MYCSERLHNPSSLLLLNYFQHHFFHENIYIRPIYTFWESTKLYTGILGEKYPIITSFSWSVRELHCNLQHNCLPLLIPLQAYCWCSQRHAGPFPGKEHPHAPKHAGSRKTGKHWGRKGFGGPGGHWAEHEPAEHPSSKEGSAGLHWEQHQQAEGGDAPPLVSTHEECSAHFRAPQDGTDMDELERVQQRATKTKGWSTSHTSQVRQLCLFSLEKRSFRGILSTPHEKVQRRKATCSFQWSPKDGRQWAQNGTQEIPFKHKKKLIRSEGVIKYWNKLSREVEGFPASEILKMWLDMVLGNQLKVTLLSAEQFDRMISEVSFHLHCSVRTSVTACSDFRPVQGPS